MKIFSSYFSIASFLICCICDLTSSESVVSCTGLFMPDPADCTKFYQCDQGRPIPFKCAGGLNWNEKINACDWPQNAPCKKPIAPSTQPDPTTPAPPAQTATPSNQPGPTPAPKPNTPTKQPQPVTTEPSTPAAPEQPNTSCGSDKKSVCYCEY